MPAIERVLVVGAGMAGMTLGLALKRCGIACEIVEIRAALTEPGTGITLQGPALRALQAVDALEGCIRRGFAQTFFKTCDAQGNVTGTVDLPRLLGPQYPATMGIMRQAVHEVLARELERLGVPIRLGLSVSALAQTDHDVDVTFTDGTRGTYDLVVGADGSGSAIREMMFGPQVGPRYTGQMNWRATVSRPPEVTGRYSYFGPTIKSGFNPVSEREMYIYVVQNVAERPRWRDEELPAMLRGLLGEFGGILGRARDEVRDPQQIICRPVFSMIMPPPWYRGRVILIGDAAHGNATACQRRQHCDRRCRGAGPSYPLGRATRGGARGVHAGALRAVPNGGGELRAARRMGKAPRHRRPPRGRPRGGELPHTRVVT